MICGSGRVRRRRSARRKSRLDGGAGCHMMERMSTTVCDTSSPIKQTAPVWASAMMLALGLPVVWWLGTFWLMLGVAVLWGVVVHVRYDARHYDDATIPDDLFRASWWRSHWLDVLKGQALVAMLALICIGAVAWVAGMLLLALLLPLGLVGAVVAIST